MHPIISNISNKQYLEKYKQYYKYYNQNQDFLWYFCDMLKYAANGRKVPPKKLATLVYCIVLYCTDVFAANTDYTDRKNVFKIPKDLSLFHKIS